MTIAVAAFGCDSQPVDVGSESTALIGDGIIDGVERCDDGNNLAGDGCNGLGQIEPGFACPIAGLPCAPDVIAFDDTFDCSNQASFGVPAGMYGWEASNPSRDAWKTTPANNNGVAPITDDLTGDFGEPRDDYENFLLTGHPLWRDVSIEADITSVDNDAMGLVARFSSGSAYYACYMTLDRAATCGGGGGVVGPRVAIVRAGTAASCTNDYVVASQPAPVFSYTPGFTYRMRLSVIGNTVSCIVDADRDGILGEPADVTVVYVDANPHAQGMAGLLSWDSGNGDLSPPRTDLVFDSVVIRTFDPDADRDGLPDAVEAVLGTNPNAADSDGDGIGDRFETLEARLPKNTDGTGAIDPLDLDSDGDGVSDRVEGRVTSPSMRPLDTDCDGVPDFQDLDSDGDGTPDSTDNCRLVASTNLADTDNDGVGNVCDSAPSNPNVCTDFDGDTCDDCTSGTFDPQNDGPDFDGDSLCDAGDPDDDNDGALDGVDSNDNDPMVCRDSDNDTCDDCVSGMFAPANDGPDFDGDGACDAGDPDDDGDGALDGADSDDRDPTECSDVDNDTCDDCSGGFFAPGADGFDFDGDGMCDAGDPDDDNDGVLDANDTNDNDRNVCGDTDGDGCEDCFSGTFAPGADGLDSDGDGACDVGDPDDDNDGIPDALEHAEGSDPDPDGDSIPNRLDLDSDGDGVYDADEAGHGEEDSGDGRVDGPRGANGLPDAVETSPDSGVIDYEVFDTDGDTIPDFLDEDSDDDFISDAEEAGDTDITTNPRDNDDDGIPDLRDVDSDQDTIGDVHEAGDMNLSTPAVDTDQDFIRDVHDHDSDADGRSDAAEAGDADVATPPIDTDGDGTPNFQDVDSDNDGMGDRADNCWLVANSDQLDTDGDRVGDACTNDADGDTVLDDVDNCPLVSNFQQLDRDQDGIGDLCDSDTGLDPGSTVTGGGCAAGGEGSGAGCVLLLLCIALARRQRRRPRRA